MPQFRTVAKQLLFIHSYCIHLLLDRTSPQNTHVTKSPTNQTLSEAIVATSSPGGEYGLSVRDVSGLGSENVELQIMSDFGRQLIPPERKPVGTKSSHLIQFNHKILNHQNMH